MTEKKYFLGCSGWYYTEWEGRFYPEKLSKSNGWNIIQRILTP
jgi:uncharacterized protein YecE (DUF72 family)